MANRIQTDQATRIEQATVESSTQDMRAEETARLATVRDTVRSLMEQADNDLTSRGGSVEDIRKHFWSEVSVNLDNAEDIIETYASVSQQTKVLDEALRSYNQAKHTIQTLAKLYDSPYFGRVDFIEEGFALKERLYIGISSLFDSDSEQMLIYDWRAPISSLFYDCSLGDAEYIAPGGIIRGTLELKRQFVIHNGQLKYVFDTGIMIGDEMLQQALSGKADDRMKTIVATIQKEQNRIIRNDSHRTLVVQGAAGSGKTSVALQRVAYLLYKHRATLQADQMVLFSPNPVFISYVSHVLPELGEVNMVQTTFQDYTEYRLGDAWQLESPFAQLESLLTLTAAHKDDETSRVRKIRCKGSSAFIRTMQNYRDSLKTAGMEFRHIRFQHGMLIDRDKLTQQFYQYDSSIRIPNRLELLKEWILKELKSLEKQQRQCQWVQDEIETMDHDRYQQIYEQLQRKERRNQVRFDDDQQERMMLAAEIVRKHFAPVRKRVKQLDFIDGPMMYERLCAEAGHPLEFELRHKKMAYEDAVAFLYFTDLLTGFPVNTNVRYVIVDEAQDYSPLQYEMLKRLFPRAKLTAVGDWNQAIFPHSSLFDGSGEIDGEPAEIVQLTKSYRSTRQIVEFTRGLLPNGEQIEPFNRDGEKPTLLIVNDEQQLIHTIKEECNRFAQLDITSIAILCKTGQQCRQAYDLLHRVLPAEPHLITSESSKLQPGTVVIPSYLAKGLEFDAVIVYDASKTQYCHESERKLFYTVCTRAMHLLSLVSIGEQSPFIPGFISGTYEQS